MKDYRDTSINGKNMWIEWKTQEYLSIYDAVNPLVGGQWGDREEDGKIQKDDHFEGGTGLCVNHEVKKKKNIRNKNVI